MATKPTLPYNLQVQSQQLDRRRKMAEALFAQNAQYGLPETKGRMAARANPMEALTKALGLYLGGRQLKGLNDEETALGGQIAERESAQAAAAKKAALIEALVKNTGSRATAGSVRDTLITEDPNALQYYTPTIVPHQINGASGVLETKPTGEQDFKYEPKAQNVTVNTGAKVDDAIDIGRVQSLEKRLVEELPATRNVIRNSVAAVDLLDQGAKAGGGQSVFQAIRKFGQAFGVDVPETGLTDQLRTSLGENILAEARKLAPVTGNDVLLLQKLIGSIDTDPQSLREISAIMLAKSLLTQDRHNEEVDRARSVTSGRPEKYDALRFNRGDLPVRNQALVARAYQLMKESGHDMKGYKFDNQPVNDVGLDINFFPQLGPQGPATPPGTPSRFKPVGR
jgi:hypothetical protein